MVLVASKQSQNNRKNENPQQQPQTTHVPHAKLLILGMAIPPLMGNPYNGYKNPYYWVDDHPLLYGNNGSLDPSTHENHNEECCPWRSPHGL